MTGVIYPQLGTTTLGTASTLRLIDTSSATKITFRFVATNYFDNDFDVKRIDGRFSFIDNPDFDLDRELSTHELIDFNFNFGEKILTQANADSFAISFGKDMRPGINVPALQGIARWETLLFSFSKLRADLPILSVGIGSLKNRHPFGFPDYARIESPPIPCAGKVREKWRSCV